MIINQQSNTEKITLITCIFGNYDCLREPLITNKNIHYICITDNPELKSDVYDIIVNPPEINSDWSSRKKTYYVRYHPFNFCNTTYCYLADASIQIKNYNNLFLNKNSLISLKTDYNIFKYLLNNMPVIMSEEDNLYRYDEMFARMEHYILIGKMLRDDISKFKKINNYKHITGVFRGYKNESRLINDLAKIFNILCDNNHIIDSPIYNKTVDKNFVNDILWGDEIISGIILNNYRKTEINMRDFYNKYVTIFEHNTWQKRIIKC